MLVKDDDLIGSDHLTCFIDNNDFRVDASSCKIYANKVFDREQQSSYVLTARVIDGLGRSSTGQVTITISDKNDNMPKFRESFFNVSVHTNFPEGNIATFLPAVDLDATDNSQFSAKFEAGDDFYFSIDTFTGGVKLLRNLATVPKTMFLFTVYVTDRLNSQTKADMARVQLNVLPPSTYPPVFKKSQYSFDVKENNHASQLVGKVKAVRAVSDSATFISYTIKDGNLNDIFAIREYGQLVATKPIDYEEHRRFVLVIEAYDSLMPTLTNNVTVIVTVVDMNDNTPRFVNRNNIIKVNEGVAIGHLLFTCETEDLDSGANSVVTYRIKHTTGHFTIDPIRGDVRTNGSLDYETSESHVIYVEATDGGRPSLSTQFKMEVQVEDVNDNPPLFFNNSQIIHVIENNNINQHILTLNASDADELLNGEFFFSLLPNDDSLSFDLRRNGRLYVVKSLDRETKSSYILRVKVQDQGTPSQDSEARVTVVVDDENDEAPKFQKDFYIFEIWEELQPGTQVGEVVANDPDTGDNGKFTYYLRDQHKDKFEIETRQTYGKHVCIVKTKKKFDSETDPDTYNITIGASDHGMNGNSNEVLVRIVVRNVNDHPPEFTRKTPYVACITVGTSHDFQVAVVAAIDRDKVPVDLVYSLVSFNEQHEASLQIFRIDKDTGIIYTSVEIDSNIANKQPVYEMVVQVEEFNPGRSYTNYQKVIVFISTKPKGFVFKEDCPLVTIKANRDPIVKNGWTVDYDRYEFTQFKYRLIDHDAATIPFSIRPNTGIIKVLTNLHKLSYYRLNVTVDATAENEGKEGKSSVTFTESIILNVYIVPKNMYPPAYPKNPETYNVDENFPINMPIGVLKSPIDRDKGMEGKCIFSLEESADAPVRVSPRTGEIVFIRNVDREEKDKIVVKIRVSDLAEEVPLRLSNTLTVAIHINDLNDNPPLFTSPNWTEFREDVAVGTTISHVHATDPDAGSTKTEIEYAIQSGNYGETFALDRFTGSLKTKKPLSVSDRQSYHLIIEATEKRESTLKIASLKSTYGLTVHVLDVNDQKPRFMKSIYTVHVKENEPIGTSVVKVEAIDSDMLPEYKAVTYEILGTDPRGFCINESDGVIYTSIRHDREIRNKFVLDVIVRNVAPPHAEDSCEVHIVIDDVNDNPPIFSAGPSETHHLLENSLPVPRPFHKLRYTDADDERNSRVTFSIAHFDNVSTAIRLDKKTGQLWLDEVLDREKRSVYVFTVEARNVKPPHQRAQQNITVVVEDVDDEDPVFQKKLYKTSVNEGQLSNTTVVTLKAVDADVASNAEVRYSILNGTNEVLAHFSVDQKTGDVNLIGSLDYETRKFYKFQVKATGYMSESFDLTSVEITVLDENDNYPVFTKQNYEFIVAKVQQNTVIGSVKATDRDEDNKQMVKYMLEPKSNDFSIDIHTGDIIIKDSNLIFGQYQLHVIASNTELFPIMKSRAEILVTVGPPNDKTLRFLNSSVVFSIEENPQNHMKLGRVVAVSELNSIAPITYEILPHGNPDSAFRIDKNNGMIFVNNRKAVDYEKHHNFFLRVLASTTDNNNKVMKLLNVLVNLTDVNDNTPQILGQNRTFYISETNMHPFHPFYIYKFQVFDSDEIDRNRLKLRIISGNEDGIFLVDSMHMLFQVKNIDYEKKSRHHLVVRVTDGGNPVRHADLHLYFVIEDMNDNKPVFQKIDPVYVSEASPTDALLTQVKAIDKDKKKTLIQYSIKKEGSSANISMFKIDDYSGNIFLVSKLDYEVSNSYKLRLCAFDGVHSSYSDLQINVLDVNDHTPNFSKSIYVVKAVYSPLKKDQFLVKVDATDRDQGDFGFVQYKLEPSLDPFMIEQDTGKIFSNKPYKLPPGVVKLTVVAYDSRNAIGSRSSSAVVEIHITQVQSPNPKFYQSIYHLRIEEHTPVGVSFGFVEAFVPSGFQTLVYSLVDGNVYGAFSIGDSDGIIRVHNDLDREKKSRYTLHVAARVKDLPADVNSLPAKCIVKIEILDMNDHQPVFEKSEYNVTRLENIPIGTKLLQVKATDKDDPEHANGKLIYSIHSGQDDIQWLWINETDGTVKTKESLDREKMDTIQLTIKVADVGGLFIAFLSYLSNGMLERRFFNIIVVNILYVCD